MKYLTYLVLCQVSGEVKSQEPSQKSRDSGIHSACWCALLQGLATSTTPASHANRTEPITQDQDIELHTLTPSGGSRVGAITDIVNKTRSEPWQMPIPLPLPPPMAHCRPRNLSSSLNNLHSKPHQISPLSK